MSDKQKPPAPQLTPEKHDKSFERAQNLCESKLNLYGLGLAITEQSLDRLRAKPNEHIKAYNSCVADAKQDIEDRMVRHLPQASSKKPDGAKR